MTEPAHPHDRLFKALTSRPDLAGTLIRERLPPDIVALLTDDPPEPLDGSFIDPDLQGTQSDRLFRLHIL